MKQLMFLLLKRKELEIKGLGIPLSRLSVSRHFLGFLGGQSMSSEACGLENGLKNVRALALRSTFK